MGETRRTADERGAAAGSRAGRLAFALLLYAALTVGLTWPLALRLRVMDPGDSAFFAWVMSWELHALRSDPAQLPHANVYHPTRHVLGLDEPVLGTTLLALPLSLFSGDAVLIFSLVRLLTYWLSALSAYLLARELRCGEAAALVSGALFAFSPIRTDQVAHLSTLGTQWLPLVPLYLIRFGRSGRFAHALGAAAAYALSFYACGYHGLLGLLAWPPMAAVLLWGRYRLLPKAALAALLAAALLLPLRALHEAAFAPHAFARQEAETARFSAGLESFLAASPWNRLYGSLSARFRGDANDLFPGLLPPLLIGAAAAGCWRARRRPSREALALAALALAGALVALGPVVRAGDVTLGPSPLALVRDALPLFARIRAYGRAGIYLALGLAALFGLALDRWRYARVRFAVLAALAMLETLVVPIPLASWARVIDSSGPPPEVYRWLAGQPGDFAIAELPLLDNRSLFERPAFHESIYMVRSTLHWKRLVNGYLGMETASYAALREKLRRFPSPEALQALRSAGARYVIVHARGFGPNRWARLSDALPAHAGELRLVARFDDDWVYELDPALSGRGRPR